MHPAIAIGRQVGDDSLDLGKKRVGWGGRTADPLPRPFLHLPGEVRAGDPEHVGHGLHREPAAGSDTDRSSPLFGPAATSSASLSTSASKVFLPSKRCNSRTRF